MSRKPIGMLAHGTTFLRSVRGSGDRRWWRRVRVVSTTSLTNGFIRIRALVLKTGEVTEWVVSDRRKVFALTSTSVTIPNFV